MTALLKDLMFVELLSGMVTLEGEPGEETMCLSDFCVSCIEHEEGASLYGVE